jgi:hypothetical protein
MLVAGRDIQLASGHIETTSQMIRMIADINIMFIVYVQEERSGRIVMGKEFDPIRQIRIKGCEYAHFKIGGIFTEDFIQVCFKIVHKLKIDFSSMKSNL